MKIFMPEDKLQKFTELSKEFTQLHQALGIELDTELKGKIADKINLVNRQLETLLMEIKGFIKS